MKIVVDIHDAPTAQEAADWLREATENFDISFDIIGVPVEVNAANPGKRYRIDPL